MPTSLFRITPTPPTSIKLKPGQEGKLSFTVNSLAAPDKVNDVIFQALLVGRDGKDKEVDWLVAGPHPSASISGGQTQTVTITARPTDDSPQGENNVKLVVADKDHPHDVYTDSSSVACEVIHDDGRPWWLIPVIVMGSLLLVGGGVWAARKLLSPPGLGEPCKPDKGCAEGLLCVPDVQKCLRAGGVGCTSAQADLCASGECKDKPAVCAIPLGGACDPGGKDAVLCPERSICDPATKTCIRDPFACTPGAQQCTPGGGAIRTCGDDGKWKTEQCPANTPQCRDGKCQCTANLGAICNCSGTVQCDGTCSAAPCAGRCVDGRCAAANMGASCGNCGGTVQVDGTCSRPNPPNLGQPCGSCGGTIQCDGSCSRPNPPNLGRPCGSCGGTIQCDGSCSRPNPPNLGRPCGSCGGRVQCDGSCSISTPDNLGQPCGECGGVITCARTCSNTTPRCPAGFAVDPDDPNRCRAAEQRVHYSEIRFEGGIFGKGEDRLVNISCGAPDRVRSSFVVGNVRGNGHCEAVWANSSSLSDCSLRIHFGASAGRDFTCGVTVNAAVRRHKCTR